MPHARDGLATLATLILPADVSWTEGGEPAPPLAPRSPHPVPGEATGSVAKVLRSGEPSVILLGGTGGAVGSIFGAMILRVISFFFRIFDIAPLLQPLFEGLILLAAVSIGALGVLRVKNTLELFR